MAAQEAHPPLCGLIHAVSGHSLIAGPHYQKYLASIPFMLARCISRASRRYRT